MLSNSSVIVLHTTAEHQGTGEWVPIDSCLEGGSNAPKSRELVTGKAAGNFGAEGLRDGCPSHDRMQSFNGLKTVRSCLAATVAHRVTDGSLRVVVWFDPAVPLVQGQIKPGSSHKQLVSQLWGQEYGILAQKTTRDRKAFVVSFTRLGHRSIAPDDD